MKLLLSDRIILNFTDLLPKKGKFEEMVAVEDIAKKVKLTQEDFKKYNIRTNENGAIVCDSTEEEFDYEFTELELAAIKKALKNAEEKGELFRDYLHLYRLFNA